MSDYDIDGEYYPVPRRNQAYPPNFVPPLPTPQRHELAPSQPHELTPVPSVLHQVTLHTTHVDRARGFAIQTGILSVVVGVLSIVAAVALFGQPLLTFWILVWFFTGFSAVWIVAYIQDRATSPDGVALFQVWGGFRLLRKEQDFRHDYLRYQAGIPDKDERRHRRKMERKQLTQKGRK